MAESFNYDSLEHFTAGTQGPVGQRVFYLQFGRQGDLVSLKVEKGQVYALAEFLDQLLEGLGEITEEDIPLALDLIDPVDPAWVVASIGVAFQEDSGVFVVVVEELTEEEDPATAELRVTPGQVKAFVERARELVASGRPPCEYCGRPLDDDDGWCPCHN